LGLFFQTFGITLCLLLFINLLLGPVKLYTGTSCHTGLVHCFFLLIW